jgi:glycerophosphodiester phosphodiesterase
VAIELNTFIDTTLDTIYRFGGDRTIILSSFTPEVCILLSIKQQAYPVLFITNAGKPPMTDLEMRAGSLQVAVRFARLWNLSGVVFASETLIMCPRLIKYVKSAGLSCASYGLLNNIPDNAKVSLWLDRQFFLSLSLSLMFGKVVCKIRTVGLTFICCAAASRSRP